VPGAEQSAWNADLHSLLATLFEVDTCNAAFRIKLSTSRKRLRFPLFQDESWDWIERIAFPEGRRETKVDGCFLLRRMPIHRGLHTDVFQALLESSTEGNQESDTASPSRPPRPVIHLLRKENTDDEQLVEWFNRRRKCWKKIRHPRVMRLYDPSDPSQEKRHPYLITDWVPGGRNVESLFQEDVRLTADLISEVLTLATQVCQEAHKKGIYLAALPARHFLMDDENRIWLTGFETAIPVREIAEVPQPPRRYYQRVSRDWDTIAPELLAGKAHLGPTIDVFALGMLLARLRSLPQLPMKSLPIEDWSDKWQCFAFHCLAQDPCLRFQTVRQFLIFLQDWVLSEPSAPMTMKVHIGNESRESRAHVKRVDSASFSMAKYLVTNREYIQFCLDDNHRLPPHLAVHEKGSFGRFVGPWLPVTHVSFEDAQAYCRWLSKRTGRKWRLPYELEWIEAARLNPEYNNSDSEHYKKLVQTFANYGNLYGGPTVVGAFDSERSAAGCFDITGNVWEWCLDYVAGEPLRVLKGGSYQSPSEALHISARRGVVITHRAHDVGFRAICEQIYE
jgi:hypothetical protein